MSDNVQERRFTEQVECVQPRWAPGWVSLSACALFSVDLLESGGFIATEFGPFKPAGMEHYSNGNTSASRLAPYLGVLEKLH